MNSWSNAISRASKAVPWGLLHCMRNAMTTASALRVLTLVKGVVRQRLSEQQKELAGLFAGNPKRRTSQPTTERLLEAFNEVTLTIIRTPGFIQRHVTPLSPLQQQILALFGLSPAVSLRPADDL